MTAGKMVRLSRHRGQVAAVQGGARLGVNVDNAAGSKTELSRKRTGDQVDAFYQWVSISGQAVIPSGIRTSSILN